MTFVQVVLGIVAFILILVAVKFIGYRREANREDRDAEKGIDE